jgi:hypothetical protein
MGLIRIVASFVSQIVNLYIKLKSEAYKVK